eukprot:Hpha_TRINITY_DN30820_c0_g1::TRINITY_DN30820_c0_g1_i1::g.155541::m.155541
MMRVVVCLMAVVGVAAIGNVDEVVKDTKCVVCQEVLKLIHAQAEGAMQENDPLDINMTEVVTMGLKALCDLGLDNHRKGAQQGQVPFFFRECGATAETRGCVEGNKWGIIESGGSKASDQDIERFAQVIHGICEQHMDGVRGAALSEGMMDLLEDDRRSPEDAAEMACARQGICGDAVGEEL